MTEIDPNVDDVRREVRDAMARGSLSQSQVARQSGISSAVVSQFLSSSYPGDNTAVAAKLRTWLDGLAAAEKLRPTLLAPSGFVPTEAAEAIVKTLDYAQADARLVAIIGEPGVGKTRSAEHLRASRSSVWLVTMKRDARSPFPMLQEIARTMSTGPAGSGADVRRRIVERLRGTKGLLIADEAQVLNRDALETLRGIYDAAGVGVAVMGDKTLRETLAHLPQFASRIGRRVILGEPSRGDVAAFAGAFGVAGDQELRFLSTIAKDRGALRWVDGVVRLAAGAALGAGQPLTIDFLKLAWQELNLRGAA